jgi:hypothetical protein
MMPKVALLLDRTATMAVRTPGLTFGDLAFNGGDRVFLVGELYHAVAFCAYVIEVQDDRIAFPAVRTPGALQVFDDELQVALPQGTALSGCPPVRIDPPRSSPQRGSAAVAIGAHELAVGDLLDDLAQPGGCVDSVRIVPCRSAQESVREPSPTVAAADRCRTSRRLRTRARRRVPGRCRGETIPQPGAGALSLVARALAEPSYTCSYTLRTDPRKLLRARGRGLVGQDAGLSSRKFAGSSPVAPTRKARSQRIVNLRLLRDSG